MNFILTNSRSLTPKINSLVDYFDERDLAFALVSETWLTSGRDLEHNGADLDAGANIGIIYKNRSLSLIHI